jgi:hypothetical protein
MTCGGDVVVVDAVPKIKSAAFYSGSAVSW